MIRAIFLCAKNRQRSPTADQIFSEWPGVRCDSAGLSNDADAQVSSDQIDWADIIFVMEARQRIRLSTRWGKRVQGKRVISLDIPDSFGFMDPKLVELLIRKAGPHLRRAK
jgi:predicted protein tyrosine phosphatase